MRGRGSVTGPLIIIALGVIFLIHAVTPDFPVADLIARYWPYLLIGWGVLALAEVAFRAARGGTIPVNGVSGGSWVFVILICIAGLTLFEIHRPDTWWRHTNWSRGIDNAFGEEHDYSLEAISKAVGKSPHIVIENFHGDAKVSGTDSSFVTVNGNKAIRAFKEDVADRTNTQTPVEVLVQGDRVVIRCNQGHAASRTSVTTNLDISVPRGASLEADGTSGDFDISSLSGDVTLRSGNSAVRLQDVGGNTLIETHRSDLVRCTNVTGTVDLRGHGSDIELTKIAGQVTINGEYAGTISLHELSKPVRVQNMRTELQVEQIPGEVRLDRGSLNMQDVIGPLRVTAHSTDVSLENFSNALDISVDRGDIDIKPGRLPLSKITAHAGSGNIEIALPQSASFALTAISSHGEIENEFGDTLREQTEGNGARLDGSIGTGPDLNLATGRGNITLRKSAGVATTAASLVR